MTVLSRRWRRRLKWSEVIIILSLLTAVLVLGVSYWLRSYYRQDPQGYRPFDIQREQQIHQKDSTPKD